jgi:tetratricopeptide (TPR) repeat protein
MTPRAAVCALLFGAFVACPAGEAAAQPRDETRLGPDALVRRGFEYLLRPRPEDQDEAARLFGKALRAGPDRADAHVGLARVSIYLYALGEDESPERLRHALEESRRGVELAPDDPGAAATRALALAADNRLTPALEEARRAATIGPASAEAHLALCTVLRLRKDNDGALQACRRAGEIAPEDPRVLTAIGETLREEGLYPQAMEIFGQAIDLDHEAIAPQLGAAATLVKGGNDSAARTFYNGLLRDWNYGKNRVQLGAAALLVTVQDFEAALQVYGSLEVPEGFSMPALLTLYGKGYSLKQLGRDAEAEYFFTSIIERVPVDYDGPARGRELLFKAYDDLIGYFDSKGRDRKVLTLLQSACERSLVPTRLARSLAERLAGRKKAEDAAGVLEKGLLGADPLDDPLEISESALMLVRLRTSNGARRLTADSPAGRALTLAVERLEPSNLGAAHYRLARALALAQRGGAALKSLEHARASGYLPIGQMAAEPDFQKIRDDPGFVILLKEPQAAGAPEGR